MWSADFDATSQRPGEYYRPPVPGRGYAQWITRVVAALLDWVVVAVPVLVGQIVLVFSGGRFGFGDLSDASTIGLVAYGVGAVITIVLGFYNVIIKQGRTGQTWAKSWMSIRLVSETDGQPLGPGRTFVRQIAHILDALPCYLGFLWPLWDSKKQTFADKVMSSVVVAT
jgi:uncharacterized RDD family membrane protein YckC